MKLEVGKYYIDANGKKYGPMRDDWGYEDQFKYHVEGVGNLWDVNGNPMSSDIGIKLMSEWTDTPKMFGEMTPEEKGALLLAAHEGEEIEWWGIASQKWFAATDPLFRSVIPYRVKPKSIAEFFMLYGSTMYGCPTFSTIKYPHDTHRITYQIIDGVVDCASIKMEPIE